MSDREPTRRCPADQRVLEPLQRWLCPRCLHEYRDGPALLGEPGRPARERIGGLPVILKLGEDRRAALDAWARERGMSRAQAVRNLIDDALAEGQRAA